MEHRPRRAWSIAGLVLLAASAVALIAMYRARPDLDPVATPISWYISGSSAWLLRATLATNGLGVLTISWALAGRGASRQAVRLMPIGGAGMLLAALADSDRWFPWQKPLTIVGFMHAVGAGSTVLVFPLAAHFFTRGMGRRTSLVRMLDALVYIFAATLLGFGVATLVDVIIGRTPGFLGLAEQLLFTIASVWLVIATTTEHEHRPGAP